MPTVDSLRNHVVTSFYDNSVMLNIAMNVEEFLSDSVILYPYKNWDKGEIISGPFIKRYFVSIILRFDYDEMPDPTGMKVLEKFGVFVTYKKVYEKGIDVKKTEEAGQKVYGKVKVWYVQLDIPRDLVSDKEQRGQIAQIEQLLDIEAIEEIADAGGEDGGFGGEDFSDEFSDDNFGSDFEDLPDDIGGDEPPTDNPGDEQP